MSQKKISQIPLIVTTLMAVYSVYVILTQPIILNGETYERGFSYSHYFGYAMIVSCWIGFFINQSLFVGLLTGALAAGLINLANYTADQMNWFGFGIGGDEGISFEIGLNPIILLIMVFHVMINYRLFKGIIDGEVKENNKAIEPQKERRDPMIDMFKKKYEEKSLDELEAIIAKPQGYQRPAVIAAQELINDNKTASNIS